MILANVWSMNISREELLSRLQDMNGHRFEELVADIWKQRGWETIVTDGPCLIT
jgi:hypothetical protein